MDLTSASCATTPATWCYGTLAVSAEQRLLQPGCYVYHQVQRAVRTNRGGRHTRPRATSPGDFLSSTFPTKLLR